MNGRGVAPQPKASAPKPAMEPPKCNCGGSCDRCSGSTLQRSGRGIPQRGGISAVQNVLRTPGAPLSTSVRTPMERAFHHDFSSVRVHADTEAARSAAGVGARAYTVGNHVAFGAGAYEPSTESGRHLLAHELAHTIQQRGADPELAMSSLEIGGESTPAEAEADRAADSVSAGSTPRVTATGAALLARAPKGKAPQAKKPAGPPQPEACGRKSNVRVPGFTGAAAGAHISDIVVDINPHDFTKVTLTWSNLAAGTPVPANPLNASAGAGLCEMQFPKEKKPRPVDCSNPADANTDGSRCTPIGENFQVVGHRCALGDDTSATRVSWILTGRGIAFHNYPTIPAFPGSHGCVRMAPVTVNGSSVGGGDWIHDNTISNVTNVHIRRAPGDPGPECYPGPKGKRGARPGYTPPAPPEEKKEEAPASKPEQDAGANVPDAGVPAPQDDPLDAGTVGSAGSEEGI